MDNLTGADNIRKEMEEKMASGKLAKKKTMSVPEMRKLLGVKKTESYWLVHRNSYSFRDAANLLGIHSSNLYEIWREEKLETFTVDFTKRIPIEVFEK